MGAGFTWPRNTTVGRMRTSRTRRIVSGLGSGGGAGELASKLSGGMMTVYTGSWARVGGVAASGFFRLGCSGWLSVPISRAGDGRGRSIVGRGKSQEQEEASL